LKKLFAVKHRVCARARLLFCAAPSLSRPSLARRGAAARRRRGGLPPNKISLPGIQEAPAAPRAGTRHTVSPRRFQQQQLL